MAERKFCIFGKEKYCKMYPTSCPSCRMYKTAAQIRGMVRVNPRGNR